MARWDVLALAELNADIIVADLEEPPQPGREVLARLGKVTLGSSTALCAAGMARLGLKVAIAGRVGRDTLGDLVLSQLQAAGVDISPVVVDPAARTGFTVAIAGEGGERSLVTYLGDTIAGLAPAEIAESALQDARHLHVSSYFLQTRLAPGLAELFCRRRAAGQTTSLDTGDDPAGRWDEGLHAVLKHTSLFIPNRSEALGITRTSTLPDALDRLTGLVGGAVAVKLGSQGAVAVHGGERHEAPPYPVIPVDTTGCGDAFNAGLLYGILSGWDWPQALRFANGCGALTAMHVGGAAAFSGPNEVARFVAQKAPGR